MTRLRQKICARKILSVIYPSPYLLKGQCSLKLHQLGNVEQVITDAKAANE